MVVSKLASGLRGVFSKISRSAVVDEALLKSSIKELQRTLISADVNVKLVFDLSKRIETRVKDEKLPSGVSQKENFIKVVYEELVSLMGKSFEPEIKPQKILLVGTYGHGKCVEANSLVSLWDGQLREIKEIFDDFSQNYKQMEEEDGFRIDPSKGELVVNSLDVETLKIVPGQVEALWKLKAPHTLYEVQLQGGNGLSITVTPEHPFYINTEGVIEEKRADTLKTGEFVAVPSKLACDSQEATLWKPLFKVEGLYAYEQGLGKIIGEKLSKKNLTLKDAHRSFGLKENYCCLSSKIKSNWLPLSLLKELLPGYTPIKLLLKKHGDKKKLSFPLTLSKELSEFLGYVVGDGHLESGYIQITTQDDEVVKRICRLSKKLFSIKPIVKIDKRRKNLKDIRVVSSGLVDIINKVFDVPVGKKGIKLRAPTLVMSSNREVVKSFIRAYIDCDGHVNKSGREIEVSSESHPLIMDVKHLLLFFGINSRLNVKELGGKPFFRLIIKGRSAESYATIFSSLIRRKRESMGRFQRYGERQGDESQLMVPVGNLLQKTREAWGLSVNELCNAVNSYSLYENNGVISHSKLRQLTSFLKSSQGRRVILMQALKIEKNFRQIVESTGLSNGYLNATLTALQNRGFVKLSINPHKRYCLTEAGLGCLFESEQKEASLEKLEMLGNSDVIWLKVHSIKMKKPHENYVYDLTVKDHHNFIANTIVVHNTTTTSKLSKFFSKRGLSPAIITTDTWRPAAYEQVQQLAEKVNVPMFGIKGEKNASKILEEGLKKLGNHELLIVDSAGRDSLNQELIDEVKALSEMLKPDQKFLVLGADMGQTAGKQAHEFNEAIDLTGVIVTRMDSSAKGGGALSACAEAGIPITFIGTGEKPEDLEPYDSEKYISRLLGYPDLGALMEKMKEVVDEEELSPEELMKGDFTLKKFYKQLEATKKMGSLSKIFEQLGMSQQIPEELMEQSEEKMKIYKHIMDSMTKQELDNPDIINSPRIKRIAAGSGRTEQEVRELLKQFNATKKMFKKFKKGKRLPKGLSKMMSKFQGM